MALLPNPCGAVPYLKSAASPENGIAILIFVPFTKAGPRPGMIARL